MKKTYIIIGILALIISVTLFIRFFLGGAEDSWICNQGKWIKHGSPSSPKPTAECSLDNKDNNQTDTNKIICNNYTPEDCPTECVVCPPCPACSSISCQKKEFCEEQGIDKSWYEEIKKNQNVVINTFEDCLKAGNPVLESYPRQCKTKDGQTFTENIGNDLGKADLIKIDSPRPNQAIKSPLEISGEARGTWYFEGTFPVVLVNWDGLIIATGVAEAQSEWMTEDFVPFKAKLTFEKPTVKNNGALILQKDNPSGLPENDDALEIPIIFE